MAGLASTDKLISFVFFSHEFMVIVAESGVAAPATAFAKPCHLLSFPSFVFSPPSFSPPLSLPIASFVLKYHLYRVLEHVGLIG